MAQGNLPVPFQKAIVSLNGGPTDDLIVHLACQLAKPSGAELIAVHIVEVDWTHDLSEDVAGRNDEAAAILDRAEELGQRYRIRVQADLLQARDVGAALVDEAVELGADAIFIGLSYRKRFGGDFALGTTLPYVLQNASGQVIVVREPMASSEARGAEAVHPFKAGATSRARR